MDYEAELREVDAEFYKKFLELSALTRRLAEIPGKYWMAHLSPNAVMMLTVVNALKIAFAENRNTDLYDALENFFRNSEEHGHLIDEPLTDEDLDHTIKAVDVVVDDDDEVWADVIGEE